VCESAFQGLIVLALDLKFRLEFFHEQVQMGNLKRSFWTSAGVGEVRTGARSLAEDRGVAAKAVVG